MVGYFVRRQLLHLHAGVRSRIDLEPDRFADRREDWFLRADLVLAQVDDGNAREFALGGERQPKRSWRIIHGHPPNAALIASAALPSSNKWAHRVDLSSSRSRLRCHHGSSAPPRSSTSVLVGTLAGKKLLFSNVRCERLLGTPSGEKPCVINKQVDSERFRVAPRTSQSLRARLGNRLHGWESLCQP